MIMKHKTYFTPSLRSAELVLEHALLGKSSSATAEKARYEEGLWDDDLDA